jgi:hypothetical protein
MLAKGRAKALGQSESRIAQIEKHLARLETEASDRARAHHVVEIMGWIEEIESNLRHMGVRTGREWGQRVGEWRRRLNKVREHGSRPDEIPRW